ncbi:MAG: hypothetical protein RR969_09210 [Thermomonas sp.]
MLAVAQVATAQSRPNHFGDIGRIACAEGAERYLPGDYYFCTANKALQAGNIGKARAMYEESAAWGDKRAMFNLGLLYLHGDGMRRDEPLGLAWLALSAERESDRLQREVLAGAWKAASPDTRSAADALWNRMKTKYADRIALVRARQRYDRETEQLRRDLQRDPTISKWIAGLPPVRTGGTLLDALDAAAQETVLRPSRLLPLGEVNIGAPETVREPARPPAS